MSGLTLHSPLHSHFNHLLALHLHFHSLHTLSLIQSSLFNYIFNSLSFNPSSFLLSKPPFPFHFIIILLIQLYFYFSINLQFTLFHFTCPHHFFFLNSRVAFGNFTYQLNYYHHLHHYPHPIIHSSITPPHHFPFFKEFAGCLQPYHTFTQTSDPNILSHFTFTSSFTHFFNLRVAFSNITYSFNTTH